MIEVCLGASYIETCISSHVATILLTPIPHIRYWLDKVFHHAPMLETLKLKTIASSLQRTVIDGRCPASELKQLELSSLHLDLDILFTILKSSHETLTSIELHSVSTSNWVALLTKLAEDFSAL